MANWSVQVVPPTAPRKSLVSNLLQHQESLDHRGGRASLEGAHNTVNHSVWWCSLLCLSHQSFRLSTVQSRVVNEAAWHRPILVLGKPLCHPFVHKPLPPAPARALGTQASKYTPAAN